jgi:hypothetical protein
LTASQKLGGGNSGGIEPKLEKSPPETISKKNGFEKLFENLNSAKKCGN